jgi:hypothetical protein
MQVVYNGISMSLVHSRPCSRTPIMSDDGTEMLYMRYVYAVVSLEIDTFDATSRSLSVPSTLASGSRGFEIPASDTSNVPDQSAILHRGPRSGRFLLVFQPVREETLDFRPVTP